MTTTIQDKPKRSATTPKRGEKKVCDIGICTWPPSREHFDGPLTAALTVPGRRLRIIDAVMRTTRPGCHPATPRSTEDTVMQTFIIRCRALDANAVREHAARSGIPIDELRALPAAADVPVTQRAA